MKKKFATRFLSWVMAAAMVISMLPLSAMAAEPGDAVAQIGEKTYATLDKAIAAVGNEPTTIKLLRNFDLDARISVAEGKTITITAETPVTITDDTRKGISLSNNSVLTIENVMLNTNGQIFLNGKNGDLTFRNSSLNMDGDMHQFSGDGYYCCAIGGEQPSNLTFDNSDVKIKDYPSTGSAIRWNGSGNDSGYAISIINTTLESTNCYAGITGTYDILIDHSAVNIHDHRGNGSNGSHFDIKDSTVNFNNNGSHGLSAGKLTIKNSVVNGNNNAYYGLTYTAGMSVDSTSVINANENGYGYIGGGLRAQNSSNVTTVAEGAKINILNNKRNGMENYGTFNVAEGATVTVTGNNEPNTNGGGIYNGGTLVLPTDTTITNNYAYQTGGGICNAGTVTIPQGVKLYNNHAGDAGDDIYNRESATINNLPDIDINTGWALDGAEDNLDCNGKSHMIDGWYIDAENARWEAHAETEDGNHITEFAETTVTGLTALKAAHGADAKDKTSYPGMDKTIVTDDGNVDSSTSAAGETVDFELETNVPDDLLNYIIPDVDKPQVVTPATNALVPVDQRGTYEITIHDDMDAAFVDPTTPVVILDRTEGEDVTLANDQYTYTSNPEDGCDFHIVIDLVALYDKGIITDADIENATPIKVTYTATLAEGTTAGDYHNTAWVVYPEGESGKDIVTVETFKINIFKYDQATNEALPGATFTLYSDEDCAEEHIVATDLSDDDGLVSFDGLDAGTYYLKETAAPEGYVCSDEVVLIEIPEQVNGDNIASVRFANSLIPHTGGMGTTLFSIVGGALIVMAGTIFVISRRKRRA